MMSKIVKSLNNWKKTFFNCRIWFRLSIDGCNKNLMLMRWDFAEILGLIWFEKSIKIKLSSISFIKGSSIDCLGNLHWHVTLYKLQLQVSLYKLQYFTESFIHIGHGLFSHCFFPPWWKCRNILLETLHWHVAWGFPSLSHSLL